MSLKSLELTRFSPD